jgi:hypothetical protein
VRVVPLCLCAAAAFCAKIRRFGIFTLDDFAMQRKGLLLFSRFAIKIIYKLAWCAQAGYFFLRDSPNSSP